MTRLIDFADGFTSASAPTVPEYVESSEVGAADGVCPLDGSGKVSSTYLPSYVDDVLSYANLAAFPVTGSTGIIYVALDTDFSYRWNGSSYTKISNPIDDTDDVPEGATNKYFSGKTTTDLPEGTNLYHTTSRARTAAVVNSTAGSETDQAPSVSAMKAYVAANGSGVTWEVAVIKDVKSNGTGGGNSSSGSWATRTLNTLSDPGSIVTSLSSNQFTLDAGTYLVDAIVPGHSPGNTPLGQHKAKLRNTTDASDAIIGTSERLTTTTGVGITNFSSIKGIVTIAGSKTFEIQHRADNTVTNGFGQASSFSVDEVYTTVTIIKIG
jgi:hypothetical protein